MAKRRINVYGIICFIFIVFIIGSTIYNVINQSILIREYKKEIATLKDEIKKEDDEIKKLNEEIKNYKKDEYIEKIARERLKMVKPGELIYIDVNKKEGF
ncbi:FtsB family cell division protein [Tepidibacter formicigenes]|jgi:cell division protein FtsL|uniref:Cell division protein FtsL n=1 Tax=Tepidibacter formicigenes DSM 15518 TaxID=1123349 RepID=A0A1M6NTA0_9FIRM|nr:septum formation initiator family protein [Tepidibacter formicigenes]SHJ98951.1 cell division protein FtsL [Tepidibacter formicigenes DSM 15518]